MLDKGLLFKTKGRSGVAPDTIKGRVKNKGCRISIMFLRNDDMATDVGSFQISLRYLKTRTT